MQFIYRMNLSTNLNNLHEFPLTQVSNVSQTDIFPKDLIIYAFYFVRIFNIVYSISCVFWLFYIVNTIHFQLRYKRSLLKRSSSSDSSSDLIQNNLFQCRETLVRNSIFLVFLSFEMCFSIFSNLIGVYSFFPSNAFPLYPLHYNCTEIIHIHTDLQIGLSSISTLLAIFSHLKHFSFSMMIWLFGASLVHLSIAARNKLKISTVVQFISGGFLLNMLILVIMFSVYPDLYAKFVQSLMDQVSLIVVLYISKKKFFPAMNSRVIDAFHLNSLSVYNTQKRLLRRYKLLVKFLLITLELYVLKNLFLYNTFLFLHSLGVESCLNHSKYYLIFPVPGHSTTEFLYNISYIFLLFVPVVDSIVYFNICLINFVFIGSLAIRFVRRKFFLRQPHRFHVLTVPLNPHVITVIAYP